MKPLERITTRYIDLEDRIRLSGQQGDSAPVVIWLTRRLLYRLLPALLQWFEHQGEETFRAQALNSFAQQAASAEFKSQLPVQASSGSAVWLVQSIEMSIEKKVLRLIFRGPDKQSSILVLTAGLLRQWLNILYDACLKAGWPLDVWPAWIRESGFPSSTVKRVSH